MIIKNPVIPENDTAPGEIPRVIPVPVDPIPDDGQHPVNVSPHIAGNAPPEWGDVCPQAVKTPDGIYAIFPTGWHYRIMLGGCPQVFDLILGWIHGNPEYYFNEEGSFTRVLPDGSFRVSYAMPYFDYNESPQIPEVWEYVGNPPAGFTLPPLTTTEHTFELVAWGKNDAPSIVRWPLWEQTADPSFLPEITFSFDVYLLMQWTWNFGLFKYTRISRRCAGIIPIMTTLGLAALLGSVADTHPGSSAGRRKIIRCRNSRS